MKKQDLEEGMRVELRCGGKHLIKELGIEVSTPSWIEHYNNDLTHPLVSKYDIVRVWQPRKSIWGREEIPEGLKGYGKDVFGKIGEKAPRVERCRGCDNKSKYCFNKFIHFDICPDCYNKLPETTGPKLPVNKVNRMKVQLLRKAKKSKKGPRFYTTRYNTWSNDKEKGYLKAIEDFKEMIKET